MRIKVIGINPSTDEYARRYFVEGGREFFKSIKEAGTEIDFAWPTKGARLTDSQYWESLDSTYIMQLVDEVDENVYDGVIIWAAGDTCLRAAKERLNIPVVGLLQSSLALALNLGRRVGIIQPRSTSTTVPSAVGPGGGVQTVVDKVRAYGVDKLLVSIRATSITGLEFDKTLVEQREAALVAAKQAVEEDGADVLILGCGGMIETADFLKEKLGIPVIDPTIAALRTCEMLVKMGLSQSKSAYPRPNLEAMVVQT